MNEMIKCDRTNRVLIGMEQGIELLNRCANSLNVVIISQIRGPLTAAILTQSLTLVRDRHPRLRSRIVTSSNGLQFETEGTQAIPLQVITNSEPGFWQTVVVSELNTVFESDRGLIRAILINSTEDREQHYLITTIHHVIIDGISGVRLHSEILQCCQMLALGREITNFPRLPVLPSLEELIANREKKKPELQKPIQDIQTLPIEKCVPYQERQCQIANRVLDIALTGTIIKSCKTQQATVHGAVGAAMMLALAEEINRDEKGIYLSCLSPVDLRKRLNPPVGDENIAIAYSVLKSFHHLNEVTSFWDLARDVSQQIKERLETEEIYNSILNYKERTELRLEHPELTSSSIFVTNIGQVSIASNYEPFELEEISYAVSTTAMGSVFGVAVSTWKRKMTLNFIWVEPLVNRETIEGAIAKTISYLSNFCKA
ncbi:phthiocerol/phthiodiolone dimycocerosyl transferase family protein [Roseofilum casamattae]|uniref:Phthiocerol/phthiodiolone dimycocerosyl transferase n=1 Tax=Roseofilum casamattae BLCC-M143 TaxID=3022442 RepID=A0ABT7BRD3_9CYAN|nr:condensation domain-containing protein [Roseofilum casamattae]MDJ1181754.1 condensation domain-containing protein [Roseofilum casamattae BLCC-M143]